MDPHPLFREFIKASLHRETRSKLRAQGSRRKGRSSNPK
jgi:hypothetical protein